MATKKADDEKDDAPVEWTPDQPIPDEEGETEAQRRVMLGRRVAFLNEQADGKKKKDDKKEKKAGSGWGLLA
jgi:hypothetical protein